MEAIGLLVTLEARPGKEADAEAFLKSAQPLAVAHNREETRCSQRISNAKHRRVAGLGETSPRKSKERSKGGVSCRSSKLFVRRSTRAS